MDVHVFLTLANLTKNPGPNCAQCTHAQSLQMLAKNANPQIFTLRFTCIYYLHKISIDEIDKYGDIYLRILYMDTYIEL